MAKSFARVHFGDLIEILSAPGGRQLVGQVENSTFESACRLLQVIHSKFGKSKINS